MTTAIIQLYELADVNGRRYSVFSWRTRLALAHKGLAWESVPVKASDKTAIAFSGQKKVPIIRDGDRVVHDSWKIAEYLEDTYPNRPSLFGGETGRSLARFFNSYADRQLVGSLFPALMLENVGMLAADDAAHIRTGMEKPLGKTLEELAAGREQAQQAFSRALDPVRSVLRTQPYVSGAKPAYPDYILFSVFQWARITTALSIVAADDALLPWFDRLLDSFDSLGRNEPAKR
jgi:glutathione S-transferase